MRKAEMAVDKKQDDAGARGPGAVHELKQVAAAFAQQVADQKTRWRI